jgi:hypothetical protein
VVVTRELIARQAPSFIVTEIDDTRALDGMQRDHPDDGLSIVIYE